MFYLLELYGYQEQDQDNIKVESRDYVSEAARMKVCV